MDIGTASLNRPRDRGYTGALGLLLAFGFPIVFAGTTQKITDMRNDALVMAVEWSVTAIVAVIAFRVQGWSLEHFGIRSFGWRDVLAAAGVLVVTTAATGVAVRLVQMPPTSVDDLRQLAAMPIVFRLALVLTAGICEEFLFRGYGIEELSSWTGSRWWAAAVSIVFFGLGHSARYGFSLALLVPTLIGAFLTLLYVWRRNLVVCMILHSVIDGIVILLVPLTATGH